MKRPVRVILVGMLLFTIAAGSEHGLAGELDPAVLVNDTVITRQRVQKSVEALMQAKHLNYGGITKPDLNNGVPLTADDRTTTVVGVRLRQ